MSYVFNEDDSVDIIVSIRKDSNPNAGCSECDFKKICRQKKFKKIECLIDELFGLDNLKDYHIELIT